ncbi:MAG: ATP-binding cassette domain-containing protein [Planctomycetes bacterium]|nr:ATP-binding cassette domain-containing protein [Planctomycetota bacterium]
MMIRVERLTRSYGSTLAVDGLSFSVDRGEIVGFLGPNGAGKSTTMRILTGYLAADSGFAEVAGIDIRKDQVGVRKRVGYLPESNPLYLDMSVAGFLDFAARVRGLDRGKRKSSIDRATQACGLRSVLGKSIGELSKGFRQRVGLSQALLHDPDLLILDEPTAGLDPNQVLEIRDLLVRLGKEKTVILSTHILQEVPAVCSRAIIISKGKKVADARISELLKKDGPVRVVCSGISAADAEAAISIIPNVQIRSHMTTDGILKLECAAPAGDGSNERIAAALVARGARLHELSRRNETLEECFHRYTLGSNLGEPAAAAGAAR